MNYFELSLDAANRAYSWGWRISLTAAVSTALGLLLLTWVARVREHDFEDQVASLLSRAAQSERRAAASEQEAARLRQEYAREAARQREIESAEPVQAAAPPHQETAPPPQETAPRARDTVEARARLVTPEQREALTLRLQQVKYKVNLRFEPNQETAEYAVAIRDIFNAAGVPVAFGSAANPSGLTGIRMAMIMTPGEGEPLPAARDMSSILHDSGFPLERPIHWRSFPLAEGEQAVARSQSTRPTDVLIFIGAKPPAK
jgi:hypothetical protein